ncbi:hypothetical protein [Kitasatospora terrestris]|uniref:Uncharacterized protein n=1 Tax=Kitasatospora terrestris TaxID=258051 RepID=A0ABP9DSM6_9ACTN
MRVPEWLPDQPVRIGRTDWPEHSSDDGPYLRLRVGQTVVLDRQPWHLLEIHEYPDREWPESYRKAWREHVELWRHAENLHGASGGATTLPPERTSFYKRPVILVLRNENLPRSTPKHWCAPASHDWQVLPEHYAVCRTCGELPPCHNGEYRWDGGPRSAEHNRGVPLIVPPDCCMGCAELIKPRVRTVRFPGPNLWYPELGHDSAVFHARSACADQVDCYRKQWRAEYTVRQPQSAPDLLFPDGEGFTLPRTRLASDYAKSAKDTSAESGFASTANAMFSAPPVNFLPAVPPAPPEFQAPSTHQPPPSGYMSHPEPSAHQPPAPGYMSLPEPSAHQPLSGYMSLPEPSAHQPPAPGYMSLPEPSAGPVQPSASSEDLDAVLRLTGALDLAMADRPAFHNAEQAARVIEELTAAVRNIALCLNGTNTRARP